jgi:hypothetical protein
VVVVVTEAVMMRPSLLFLVVLFAAGKPCVCVCVCGHAPTLFRAFSLLFRIGRMQTCVTR